MIYEPTDTNDDWRIDQFMKPFLEANKVWFKLHPIQFEGREWDASNVLWNVRLRFGIGYGERDDKLPFVVPPFGG